MDEKTKKELTSNNGKLIELADYDIRVGFDEHSRTHVNINFYKKTKNQLNTHIKEFSDEDIDTIIQDLKDLSDWRHYQRLKNKLHSKNT